MVQSMIFASVRAPKKARCVMDSPLRIHLSIKPSLDSCARRGRCARLAYRSRSRPTSVHQSTRHELPFASMPLLFVLCLKPSVCWYAPATVELFSNAPVSCRTVRNFRTRPTGEIESAVYTSVRRAAQTSVQCAKDRTPDISRLTVTLLSDETCPRSNLAAARLSVEMGSCVRS